MGPFLSALFSTCDFKMILPRDEWRVEGKGALGIAAAIVVVVVVVYCAPEILPWFKR